ncbi:MAG: hypothetical protein PHI29_12150 [Gallionella sp.]|nr:hypothetical protein [Gallionella sp.]
MPNNSPRKSLDFSKLQSLIEQQERELVMARRQLELYAEDFRRLLNAEEEQEVLPAQQNGGLATLEKRDDYMAFQAKDEIEVGELCALLAWRHGMDSSYCVALRHAARLTQKIVVSDDAMARNIAQARSEWFNGQGIPARLSGKQIPLCARIYALVEYVLPLIDPRCCRFKSGPPFSFNEVRQLLARVAGRQFDPELIQLLLPDIDRLMKPLQSH